MCRLQKNDMERRLACLHCALTAWAIVSGKQNDKSAKSEQREDMTNHTALHIALTLSGETGLIRGDGHGYDHHGHRGDDPGRSHDRGHHGDDQNHGNGHGHGRARDPGRCDHDHDHARCGGCCSRGLGRDRCGRGPDQSRDRHHGAKMKNASIRGRGRGLGDRMTCTN